MVRQPVADRELPQAPGIRRIARTDDPEPDPQPDHDRAPHDQRPQDQIAQHDVLGDDLAQTLRADDEHLPRLAHDRRHEHGLTGDESELAEEAVRAMHADDPLALFGFLHDGDLSRQDDEEAAVAVALAVQDVALVDRPALADARQGGDLLLAEAGERAIGIRGLGQRRVGRSGHLRRLSRPVLRPRLRPSQSRVGT